MSDSNWGRYLAIGLGVLAYAYMLFDMGAGYSEHRTRGDTIAAKHQTDSAEDIASRCVTANSGTFAECVAKENKAQREHKRSEQDLGAQQGMAEAAWWMVFVSSLTVLITFLGVFFVKQTLDATSLAAIHAKTMADEATKATVAATKAADASVKATNAMIRQNEMSQALQRPWVTVECLVDKIVLDGAIIKIRLRLIVKNIGKTMARRVRHETLADLEYGLGPEDVQAWFKKNRSPPTETSTLMPNDGYEIKLGGDYLLNKIEAKKKEANLVVRASLTYSREGSKTLLRTQMAFVIGVKQETSDAMDGMIIRPDLPNGDHTENHSIFRCAEGQVT